MYKCRAALDGGDYGNGNSDGSDGGDDDDGGGGNTIHKMSKI